MRIADLPAGHLGISSGNLIWVDQNAAGLGWFVDGTPGQDEEFGQLSGSQEPASSKSSAAGKVDLLSVLEHEFGHMLGLDHDVLSGVMAEALAPGVRRVPGKSDVDRLFAGMA